MVWIWYFTEDAQWEEFGFDVSPLRDAIGVNVEFSREVYYVIESRYDWRRMSLRLSVGKLITSLKN